MSDPSLALQDGVEAALMGDPALAALMGGTVRVFTMTAPVGAAKPYLVIGEDQIVPDENSCWTSDDAYTRVHVWTLSNVGIEASRREAKAIAGRVRALLLGDVSVEGYAVIDQACEQVQHLTAADGLTAHSVVDHRFHLEPA